MPRLLVGVAALLFVLAGCGGDPKADPSPTPSASSSTTPAPPAPPVMPEAAKADTKAGAIAFVRYYVGLINYAQSTGRLNELQAFEDQECGSCNNGRQYLRNLYAAGGSIRGGAFDLSHPIAVRNPSLAGWTVTGRLTFGPQDVISSSPQAEQHLKGGNTHVTFYVARRVSGWHMHNWTRAQ